jgi:hypothetical protein
MKQYFKELGICVAFVIIIQLLWLLVGFLFLKPISGV